MIRLFCIGLVTIVATACKEENVKEHSISEHNPIDTTQQKSKTELIYEWETWLLKNNKYNTYLYDTVSTEHIWAINSLCNMFYSGDKNIKGNIEMIQWILDRFCPIKTTDDEKKQYEKIEKQISSLLNFDVDPYLSYEIRRKSAISRLLYEFKINVYEEKLRSQIQDQEAKRLFDEDVLAWDRYMESTLDAFDKIVLGKGSYNLKYAFWNNYYFDLMEQRYCSLVCLFLKDYSVWNVDNQCRWDEVGYMYDHFPKQIKQLKILEYDYSYKEKIIAFYADKEAFMNFLDAHFELGVKLDIINEGYLLRHKVNTMERLLEYYDCQLLCDK